MKKQFCITTIINILLWGCESLTLHATDLKQFEVFHHKKGRRGPTIGKSHLHGTVTPGKNHQNGLVGLNLTLRMLVHDFFTKLLPLIAQRLPRFSVVKTDQL
jgi:hypothetical protein